MRSGCEIRTKDGFVLSLNHYEPGTAAGKVMIIASTADQTKEFYDPFAQYMCAQGFSVIAFDFRGMGMSAPEDLKDYEASMHQWAVQDIDAMILHAKNNYPRQEIIYLGHCTGGEIVGLAQASQYIHKLVLISSALSCKKYWSLRARIRSGLMKLYALVMDRCYGYFPGKRFGFEVNFPRGVMLQYLSWCSNSNGLFDAFPDNNYRKLQIPVLAYNFSDDWHSPEKAVKELLSRFANACITSYYVQPEELGLEEVGNKGFFSPRMETILWNRVVQWLNKGERDRIKTTNYL